MCPVKDGWCGPSIGHIEEDLLACSYLAIGIGKEAVVEVLG